MNDDRPDLDALFQSAPAAHQTFDPADFAHLPAAVQRYLAHAIAPGTPLASAVRLRMHGTIKVKRWRQFTAEQVIVRGHGMIWRAKVRMGGVAIRGYDRYTEGEGSMRWRLCGTVPMMHAEGADVTRSAAARFAAESIWLPSVFCDPQVAWTVDGQDVVHARFAVDGVEQHLVLSLSLGAVQSVALKRWGNPDGGTFALHDFGAQVEQEGRFGSYTIPRRLHAGWQFGSPRFDDDGRFFQATIDDAAFR
jgi:hypothetical protein